MCQNREIDVFHPVTVGIVFSRPLFMAQLGHDMTSIQIWSAIGLVFRSGKMCRDPTRECQGQSCWKSQEKS